jgi:uncharacterized protein YndB with AHSA1/START domain
MLKKVFLVLVVLASGFAVFVSTRPAELHVERSATMRAPAEIPFGLVNDFHHWPEWSPWQKLDPTMKITHSGSPSGVGASYAWIGNDKVGEGSMTILSAQPNEKIVMKLEFLKPFKATNQTTFSFKTAGDQTTITWAMDGQNNFMAKAFSVFMDMDKMVGTDFEKGLTSIKSLAEPEAQRRVEEAKKQAEAAAKTAAAAMMAVPLPAPTGAPPPIGKVVTPPKR